MAIKKENRPRATFSKITIGLASPDSILERSYGEVLKPETINYRTYKPERDGLFCERIFWSCQGLRMRLRQVQAYPLQGYRVRSLRGGSDGKKGSPGTHGHIKLVVPVVHIWYFKSLPNKIGYLWV